METYSTKFGTAKDHSASREEKPFNLYLDFWLLAVAVGSAKSHHVPIDPGDRHRFIEGGIFQRDLPTIEFLLLLAISHEEDPYIVNDPRKVLDIAEGYAAGGIPLIKEMMYTGHINPQQNLTRCLLRELSPAPEARDS